MAPIKPFQGKSPDFDGRVVLYLKRDDPEFKTLLKAASGMRLRANLALAARPEGRRQRQFEITKINAFNWQMLEAEKDNL